MNFLELQDMALGDDFATTYRDNAKRFINQAYGRLYRALRLPTGDARAVVTTVAGTNVYALPADFVALADDDAIFLGTDVLEPIDVSELDQATAASGQPTMFALSENLILLYPNPNAAYDVEMRYQAAPQLSGDTEVPAIPADQQPNLAWFARAKLYLLADDPQMHGSIMGALPRELQYETLASGQQRVPKVRQIAGTWSRMPIAPVFRNPQGLW